MFYLGDKVAVLSSDGELFGIDTIDFISEDRLCLAEYGDFTFDGKSMSSSSNTRIVPATPEHFTALGQRGGN